MAAVPPPAAVPPAPAAAPTPEGSADGGQQTDGATGSSAPAAVTGDNEVREIHPADTLPSRVRMYVIIAFARRGRSAGKMHVSCQSQQL